jgi:hypothetical protein
MPHLVMSRCSFAFLAWYPAFGFCSHMTDCFLNIGCFAEVGMIGSSDMSRWVPDFTSIDLYSIQNSA